MKRPSSQKRVAMELRGGTLVNLGIGLPTPVTRNLPADVHVFFQSENGLIGMQPLPEEGFERIGVTDAGCNPGGAVPRACALTPHSPLD